MNKVSASVCARHFTSTTSTGAATRTRRLLRHAAALLAAIAFGAPPAQAQLAVTPGGQASYSYPIAVPPGIAGMAPQLSLSYAQGGLNGPLGVGWSLQGISAITRCPANKATDGAAGAVHFDGSDKLCLDGQRLVQTDENGNPAATQNACGRALSDDALGVPDCYREYRTEKDSYTRVRAYGSAGAQASNGPATFKAWTKSGLVYEYGTNPNGNANALVNAQGKTAVAVWAVSRVSDVAGNFMDFKYSQRDVAWGSGPASGAAPGHEWNLAEIQYTGNGSQVPVNKVVFEYEDRAATVGAQDRSEAYHQGSKNVSIARLKAIRSIINWPGPALGEDANGTPLPLPTGAVRARTLKLEYDSGPVTNRSRLVRLRECAGTDETVCLPPTSFAYSAGGDASFTASTAFNLTTEVLMDTAGNYGTLTGDFNGDGMTDILRWGNSPADNKLWLASASGSFTAASAFNIKDQKLFSSNQCDFSIAADFNGDGMTDILRVMRATAADGSSCGTLRHVLYLASGNGAFTPVDVTGIDFTQEVGVREAHYSGSCTSPQSPARMLQKACPDPQYLGTSQTEGRNFHLLDVNGDGLLDIVTTLLPAYATTTTPPTPSSACAGTVCTHVYLGSQAGTFTELSTTNLAHQSVYGAPPSTTGNNYFRKPYVSDVNGDGRIDLLVESGVWLGRGDGNFDRDPAANVGLGCEYPLDFNGDGRSDCLRTAFLPAGQTLVIGDGTYAQNTSANFNLIAAGQELFSSGTTTNAPQTAGIAILDGFDGVRPALLRWKDDPTQNKLYLSNGDGSFQEAAAFNLNTTARGLQNSSGAVSFEIGDFAGTGQFAVLRKKAGPTAGAEATTNQLYLRSDATPPDLLTRVTSSSGAVSTLTYEPLPRSARYKTDRGSGSAATYPKVDLALPLYVVTTVEADAGVGSSTIKSEYLYAGLKSSYNGRGLLGFRETLQQSVAPNGEATTVYTRYHQDHPYIGMANYSETRRGTLAQTSAPVLSSTANIYCDKTARLNPGDTTEDSAANNAIVDGPCRTTAKVARPYLLSSTERGWDLSGTPLPQVVTQNKFNSYGDATSVTVTTSGMLAGANQTYTKTVTNSFCEPNTAGCRNRTDGDNWILGRLDRATVRQMVPNSVAALTASAPLAVTSSPSTLTLVSPVPGTVTGTVVASGNGGVPPYRFDWTRTSGSRIAVQGGQLATFSTTVAQADNFSETFRVTLTDAVGTTANATVSVAAAGPQPPPPPPTFAVTLSPASISDTVDNTATDTTTVTAQPANGVAPFTYAWSLVSSAAAAPLPTVTSPSSATTDLRVRPVMCDIAIARFRVTVTDATGKTASGDIVMSVTSRRTGRSICP